MRRTVLVWRRRVYQLPGGESMGQIVPVEVNSWIEFCVAQTSLCGKHRPSKRHFSLFTVRAHRKVFVLACGSWLMLFTAALLRLQPWCERANGLRGKPFTEHLASSK